MNIEEIFQVEKSNEKILFELSSIYSQNLLIPFVGGGMSIPLYPSWSALLKKLLNQSFDDAVSISKLEELLGEKGVKADYEAAAEFVYDKSQAFLMKNINDIFDINILSKSKIPTKLLYLATIFDGPTFTTNFDRCLERAYDIINKPFISVYNVSNIRKRKKIVNRTIQSNSRKLFKLHGDYDDFDSLIFTKKQYEESYGDESFKDLMEDFSKYRHFLFIGCSLEGNDRYMKVIEDLSSTGTYHYTFLPHPDDVLAFQRKKEILARHGIYAIWYPKDKHDESIQCLLNYLYHNKFQKNIDIDNFLYTNAYSCQNTTLKEFNNMQPYKYQNDIIESPYTSIYETSNNQLKINFANGALSLTLPHEWESHFVVYHDCICSKKAFNNNKYDGKIISIIAKKEFISDWPFSLIGYYDNTFYYAVQASDVRYDMDNIEESEEYHNLSSLLPGVLSSSESYSTTLNKTNRIFDLHSKQITGIVVSDNVDYSNKLINCYSTDYVLDKTLQGIIHQVKPYWEIHIKRAIFSQNRTWYECSSSNEEHDYGWIESKNILFDSPYNCISKRIPSKEPIVSANLKAKWASKEMMNPITYNVFDDIERNVAFITDRNVSEFTIHSKDINGCLTLVYSHGNLNANQYLIVGLDFPGDFSAYEISYLDENGLRRQYVISVSGRDGSIYLS